MEHLGQHVIIEFWGCNDGINDADLMRTAIIDAVRAANATLLDINVHTFSPHGVTGVAVLSESHLSVHSWPEYGYLAADVFTCGATTDPGAAVDVLRRYFKPRRVELQELRRGVISTTPRKKIRSRRRAAGPRSEVQTVAAFA
jgi:S-adenosylmethionine decarboxylase